MSNKGRDKGKVAVCIYFETEHPLAEFNREHVVPLAFGQFKGALVLHQTVCAACNTFFSSTLDLSLARQSAEGLERYVWAVKEPSEVTKFGSGVTLRAAVGGDYEQ